MGSAAPNRLGLVGRYRWWWEKLVPLLVWTALILLVASLPSSFFFQKRTTAAGMPRRFIQYPYHVGAFLVLAILFSRCLRGTDLGERPRRAELLALLGAVSVSICSELIQIWVPTRTPAARDVALDLSGALLGLGLIRVRCSSGPTLPMDREGKEPSMKRCDEKATARSAPLSGLWPQSPRSPRLSSRGGRHRDL